MDHPLPVRRTNPRTDPAHQSHATLDREVVLASQKLAQRRSFDKLHHDVRWRMRIISLAEIVNRNHVGMTQHRRRPRLPPKTRQSRIVFNKLAGQDLYRDVVSDVNTSRTIDHAHPAFTETRHELIFAVDLVTD